ncbi:MAG: hypothetical protein IIC95_02385 [Chloroflexi bacterium]|nr:hypothetical protein [Chloroflexota bacterium]MCH7654816.1 hypothetical protein [Chloroflexota bacterium]
MSTSVFQLIERLRAANRVVLVLLVLGAGMLAYDAWLGLRYWDGLSRGTAAQSEAKALLAAARGPSGVAAVIEAQVAPTEELLESRSARFGYEHTDELIELVAATARTSGVALASINIAEAGRRADGPLSYRMLSLTIRVTGGTEAIYGFLDALSEAAPGMTVRSARLGNLSGAPWASLDIDVELDPEPSEAWEATP